VAGCGRPISDSNLVTKSEVMKEFGCFVKWEYPWGAACVRSHAESIVQCVGVDA